MAADSSALPTPDLIPRGRLFFYQLLPVNISAAHQDRRNVVAGNLIATFRVICYIKEERKEKKPSNVAFIVASY